MNKRLLLKVKAAILARPEHFDMAGYIMRNGKELPSQDAKELGIQFTPEGFGCGTTACISGWAAAIWNQEHPNARQCLPCRGREPLGLTYEESHPLFWLDEWPRDFVEAYEDARTAVDQAQVAAAYIDYFIEQNKD